MTFGTTRCPTGAPPAPTPPAPTPPATTDEDAPDPVAPCDVPPPASSPAALQAASTPRPAVMKVRRRMRAFYSMSRRMRDAGHGRRAIADISLGYAAPARQLNDSMFKPTIIRVATL